MRMNNVLLGYLQNAEATRRQAENPYLYLNQMADVSRLHKIYNARKDTVVQSRETDSVRNEMKGRKSLAKTSSEIGFYSKTGKEKTVSPGSLLDLQV